LAKFFSNQMIAARRFVSLVEQEVESLEHRVQTPGQFFAGRYLEGNVLVADLLFGARQSFGNRGLGGKKRFRDFARTERTESFERQRGLIFRRHDRMTTGKH